MISRPQFISKHSSPWTFQAILWVHRNELQQRHRIITRHWSIPKLIRQCQYKLAPLKTKEPLPIYKKHSCTVLMAHQAKMQMKMKLFSHQQRGCQPTLPKERMQCKRLALQDIAIRYGIRRLIGQDNLQTVHTLIEKKIKNT